MLMPEDNTQNFPKFSSLNFLLHSLSQSGSHFGNLTVFGFSENGAETFQGNFRTPFHSLPFLNFTEFKRSGPDSRGSLKEGPFTLVIRSTCDDCLQAKSSYKPELLRFPSHCAGPTNLTCPSLYGDHSSHLSGVGVFQQFPNKMSRAISLRMPLGKQKLLFLVIAVICLIGYLFLRRTGIDGKPSSVRRFKQMSEAYNKTEHSTVTGPSLKMDKTDFFLNGKPLRILSGAIHYFRVVPEYWRDRLLKLKAMGLNTIET